MSTLNIVNTTPHNIRIKNNSGDIVSFLTSDLPPIRCNQVLGSEKKDINGCKVIEAGIYIIDHTSLKDSNGDLYPKYVEADILIVSTIVANGASELRKIIGRDIRIVVPDSGPSAVRHPRDHENKVLAGQIDFVVQFLEY